MKGENILSAKDCRRTKRGYMSEVDDKILHDLRKKIFLTGYKGGMAHLASCFSCLEIVYSLYVKKILRLNEENPKDNDRDRFIMSKGHAGLSLYACMAQRGLIPWSTFESYLQEKNDRGIGGEPCMRDCEWIEATTGSLGHGLSFGVGVAMGLRAQGKSSKVYVLLGDGECEEGTIWEAAMSAASFGLDNLVVILDMNDIQKMDTVAATIGLDNWKEKFEAFGFTTRETDGHDVEAIKNALTAANDTGKPLLVVAHTIKGKGVSIMENNPNWHFKLPGRKELKVFMSELGISDSELE